MVCFPLQICYKIKSSQWTVVRDPLGTMGPYAYKGNQWVGFDDVETIRYKVGVYTIYKEGYIHIHQNERK